MCARVAKQIVAKSRLEWLQPRNGSQHHALASACIAMTQKKGLRWVNGTSEGFILQKSQANLKRELNIYSNQLLVYRIYCICTN